VTKFNFLSPQTDEFASVCRITCETVRWTVEVGIGSRWEVSIPRRKSIEKKCSRPTSKEEEEKKIKSRIR
jgi:hypothetical protein